MMLRGLFDRILALAATIVFVAGVIGFMIEDLSSHNGPLDMGLMLRLAIQSFTQTVRLFWINISSHPETDNWLLMCARVCGAVVAAAAAFRLITKVFGRDYNAFKATFYRNHTVILGFGQRNALLADSWRAADPHRKQIVLDNDETRVRPLTRDYGRLFFHTDLALHGSLTPANIPQAEWIIIGTGSDERNLAISQQVVDWRQVQNCNRSAKILVTLDDAILADSCRHHPTMARLANGDEFHFFNNAQLSARQLLARTPLIDHALASGQTRVRLLFAGFSQTALEIIIQFLRIAPLETLEPARFDIVTPNIYEVADLIIERAPNLRHMLEEKPAAGSPLSWAGRIHLHRGNPAMLSHASDLSSSLEEAGAFTAIIIAGNDVVHAGKTALAIRSWTAQRATFAAPIYVQARIPSSLKNLYTRFDSIRPKPMTGPLVNLAASMKAGDVIEPFGMLEEICSPEFLFGAREHLARRLHAAYRQRRLEALQNTEQTTRSDLPDWKWLDETYCQANRRAVDFLPVARLVAGVPKWWDGDGLPPESISDPAALEKLSRFAHASWRIDRELDGWRLGDVRDPERRLHTDLVPYEELSEEKKELDREQIRLLATFKSAEVQRR